MGMQNVRSSSMEMFHHSVRRVILNVSCAGANAKNVIVPRSPSAKSTLGSSTPRRSPTHNAPPATHVKPDVKNATAASDAKRKQTTQTAPPATHVKHDVKNATAASDAKRKQITQTALPATHVKHDVENAIAASDAKRKQTTQTAATATHAKHYANHVQRVRTNAARPATTVKVAGTLMPKTGDSEVAEIPTTIRPTKHSPIDVSLKIMSSPSTISGHCLPS